VKITYEQRAAWYDFEQTILDDQAYLETFVKAEGQSVLEIPCASGRNISWLLASNQRVVLSDLSFGMLEVCKIKLAKLGQSADLVHADMCKINLSERVDTIIIPQDGILLLRNIESISEMIETMWQNLNPNGKLLIDIPLLEKCRGNAPCKPLYFESDLEDSTKVEEWKKILPNNRILSRCRTQKRSDDQKTWEILFEYKLESSDGELIGIYDTKVVLLNLTLDQVKGIIPQSKFKTEAVHQDYHGNRVTNETCRLILRLRKRGETDVRYW